MATTRAKKEVKHKQQFPPEEYTEKFTKSKGTNIKRRALNELNNPDVVCMLGGKPQYIHSTAAYFRAGLKTAENAMLTHLNNLVAEQQDKMKTMIEVINSEWQYKLDKAFKGTIPSFSDFQKFWNAHITQNEQPNEFMAKMAQLASLKEAKTKLSILQQTRDKARKSVKIHHNGAHTEASAKELQDKLSLFDFTVGLSSSGNQYSYGGVGKELEKEWNNIIQQSTEAVIKQLSDNNLEKLIDSVIDAQIQAYRNNTHVNYNLTHTEIGKIFEFISQGVYKNVFNNTDIDKKLVPRAYDMYIERIAAEAPGSGESVITDKGDSKVQFVDSIGTDVILEFVTSDKTGQNVDFTQSKIDLNTKNIDQFTSGLNSQSLDFSKLQLNVATYNNNSAAINSLINYVMANAFAFSGQVSVKYFKEIIVMFLAWMKVVVEIIGDTTLDKTPLAVRTFSTIYNTADLLNLFINIAPRDIFKYIRQKDLSDFYKASVPLANSMKNTLFASKKAALKTMGAGVSYEKLKNNTEKPKGSIVPSVSQCLDDIYNAFIQVRPSINASFLIKLNNLHSTF